MNRETGDTMTGEKGCESSTGEQYRRANNNKELGFSLIVRKYSRAKISDIHLRPGTQQSATPLLSPLSPEPHTNSQKRTLESFFILILSGYCMNKSYSILIFNPLTFLFQFSSQAHFYQNCCIDLFVIHLHFILALL